MAWLSVDLLQGLLSLKRRQHQGRIMDTDEDQDCVWAAGETQTTKLTQALEQTTVCLMTHTHTHTGRLHRNGLTGHLGPCSAPCVGVQAALV